MSGPLLRRVSADQPPPARRRPVDAQTLASAAMILADIERRGEAAVRDHAARLGDLTPGAPLVYDRSALRAACSRLPPATAALLERTAERIRAFARAQRECLTDLETPVEGGLAGHRCVPVRAAGCYAPGGRFPLPSSVLMTAIPARVAGVAEVWAASPRPTDTTLAAAWIAGVDGLLAIGGVQAVAAMTLGLCGLPECDIIAGPGNRWVTAAKFLVSDRVGIDMLAGPSELAILADDSADPALIAADLLAQAEHDDDAVPILVATDASLPDAVEASLRPMLAALPARPIAEAALRNGYALVCRDMASALAATDRLAPEHLEIMTRDAPGIAARVRNAGTIFLGPAAAEVLGDYGAGPNHVLPTGGTARFRAGLSVFNFLRPRTWLRIDNAQLHSLADAAAFARLESLEGHARAADLRIAKAAGPVLEGSR